MYTQSPRVGVPRAAHRSHEATAQGGRVKQSAKPLTLSDLHALVLNLNASMLEQERKITALEEDITVLRQENSDLWQEIHRLKGPRFPLEIFFLIVNAARDDEKALKTFSLVCKSWMPITRKVLFAEISLYASFLVFGVSPVVIFNNPHCTIFPHVLTITIHGSGNAAFFHPAGLDDILLHMHKFTSLTTLHLHNLGQWDFDAITWVIPPVVKQSIRRLDIYCPGGHTMSSMSSIAPFISNFTELTTLEFGDNMEENDLASLLGANRLLIPPPSNITKLVLYDSGHLPSSILEWFTNHHSGIIKSLAPYNLPTSHPIQFRHFINRFEASLSEIELSISEDDSGDTVHFLNLLSRVKSIVIKFLPIIPQLPPSLEEISLVFMNFDSPVSYWDDAGNPAPPPPHLLSRYRKWSQIDHTLVGGKLPSLRNLRVVFNFLRPGREDKDIKELMLQLLPRFAKERILTIEFTFRS
ncbi:hypothetical protein B0H14DRAFT_2989758 [Mycena olivaceomarginata]|nr:hypothetical protein B0H14DRAFT_2989758 [Mycena olivaceomarginata]